MNVLTKFVTSEKHLATKLAEYSKKQITPILDYAIEHNDDLKSVQNYVDKKISLFRNYPMSVHSLKLSSIGLNYQHYEQLIKEAQKNGCVCLIDAEDYSIQSMIDLYTNKLILNHNNEHPMQIFKTYQMYRKDSMENLLDDIEMFRMMNLTHNIKLVRGAYLLNDRKHHIIHDNKSDTDDNYDNAAKMLTTIAHTNPKMNVIFATHNKRSIDIFKHINKPNMHHAVLMGMDKHLYLNDHEYKINRMVHIPFGPIHKTYAYMIRRLVENNPILNRIL